MILWREEAIYIHIIEWRMKDDNFVFIQVEVLLSHNLMLFF